MSPPEMERSIVELSVSMTGRTEVTSMCSVALAICSSVSALTIWRASSSTLREASAKPCSFTVMVYSPASRLGSLKSPDASLMTVRSVPVARLVSVTVAPGSAPPD